MSFLLIMLGLTLFLISPALAFNAKQLTIPTPPSSLPGLPASGIEGLRSFEETQADLQRQGIDNLPGNLSGQLAWSKEVTKALGESLTQEQRQAISEAFSTHEPALKGLIAQTEALKNQSIGKTVDMEKARELYAQVKGWETALTADVEKVMTWQQRSQYQASRQDVPDPQGDEQTLKALGIDPSASGSEATGEQVGSQSHCYYGYYYGYYGNLYAYYAYVYSYYAYIYTGNIYAYYAYAYFNAARTYSYYGYLYSYYAYAYYYNATYAYYGYLYNYYGYAYAHNGYVYAYYAYAYTGNGYAYYAYLYGSYTNTYTYYGYYYSYYGYTDTGGLILNVSAQIQEQNQWCWAATDQAIMMYRGVSVAQCTLANYIQNRSDCCTVPSSANCNKPAYTWQMQNVLTNWGFYNTAYTGPYYNSGFTWSTLVAQINAYRPFDMNWQWNGGGGHAMTVRGYSGSNVYYIDPWLSGGGYKVLGYSLCVYTDGTGGHKWGDGIYNIYK